MLCAGKKLTFGENKGNKKKDLLQRSLSILKITNTNFRLKKSAFLCPKVNKFLIHTHKHLFIF